MKLHPFFKAFGSKYSHAKDYPAPLYGRIIEPFALSAGYATNHHDREVWLADIDPEPIELWAWLIGADAQDVRSLPCETLQTGQDIRELGLSPGAAQLIRRWQRIGNCTSWTVSGFCTGDNAWCKAHGKGSRGQCSGVWHPSIRERTARQVEHIKHWKAINCSYEQLPRVEASWFLDPPYQHVRYGYRFKDVDYRDLGAWVRSLPGQVIVCEQAGADWLPFRPAYEMSGMREKLLGVAGKTAEVLWTNDET